MNYITIIEVCAFHLMKKNTKHLVHELFNLFLYTFFNLYWLRVRMSYHIFNNSDEILNEDLADKIGQVILSKYFMDRECNCSLPYKFNRKCFYEGKCRSKCLIYQVKCSMCDAIYIGNTQQTKKMDSHFSDLLRLIKNR